MILHHLRPAIAALSFLAISLSLNAEVTLAPMFSDGAVLQQGRKVPIWGTADSGERITVQFSNQNLDTYADANGNWRVDLAPLSINAESAELVIIGTTTLRVKDVLVGEVWLCSGQSNMERTFRELHIAPPSEPEINDPLLRHFTLRNTASQFPQTTVMGTWASTSVSNAATLSAVAYFFGRDLRDQLNVPVGLINASWGGTQIESWMSPSAIINTSFSDAIAERWAKILVDYPAAIKTYKLRLRMWEAEKAASSATGQSFTRARPFKPFGEHHQARPSSIYNGMIHPLIPASISGVIGYQGESYTRRTKEYRQPFPAMIKQWRQDFDQPNMPFYFVQLANLDRGTPLRQWAYLREAQTTALDLAFTGMAVAIDIGESDDIHPKNKHDVGRRLALLALAEVYKKEVHPYGPRFDHIELVDQSLRIHYARSEKLVARANALSSFEIAGADQIFLPAQARIEGTTVLVSSPEVPSPTAVRYAFNNNSSVNLYNEYGLPAEPFRSDSW